MARKPKVEWSEHTQAFMIAVGENLRKKRLAAKKSLRELGAEVGLSKSQLSYIERGEREFSASYFDRFAQALDVPVHTLIPYPVEPVAVAIDANS